MSHGHVSNVTFVYLNIDYHHQGHFFVRESNDSQYRNTGGGVKVIIIWIVHQKNACFWETWAPQKFVKNPRKHLLRLASDFQCFFCRLSVGRFPIPFPFPYLCLSYGNEYSRSLPITFYGQLHPWNPDSPPISSQIRSDCLMRSWVFQTVQFVQPISGK